MVIPGNEAGEGATGLRESDDYFKTERVKTEGRIDGTAVLSGRSDNPDIADEGVTKKQVMANVDQGMSPREAIAAANADSRAEQDAQSTKRGMKIPRQGQTATPAPKKVSKAAGESPNEYVTKDVVSGKWRAFAPNLAATGKAAYALFDNVKDANEYTKSVDPEHEAMMAAELAAFDAEFGITAPTKETVGTVADAISPTVLNKGTEILTKAGLDGPTAATITQQGIDMATGAATTLVGGGEVAAQGDTLQQAQDRLSSKKAEGGANTANIVTTTNSTNASVVNNTTVSQGMPTSQNDSTRSHYRGRRI
jgi:hypothetical protein